MKTKKKLFVLSGIGYFCLLALIFAFVLVTSIVWAEHPAVVGPFRLTCGFTIAIICSILISFSTEWKIKLQKRLNKEGEK